MNVNLNVASHLARMATEQPQQIALQLPMVRGATKPPIPHRAISFYELNATADALAHGLSHLGISRGMRVALMVPPCLDFFTLTFALFKVAAVPVLIDPGMGIRNLGVCLGDAEPEAFIGIGKAHLARRILRWARKTIRITVDAGPRRFFCSASIRDLLAIGVSLGAYASPEVVADDLAAILFTSGSTGIAKGAEYTHRIFSAQVEMLKSIYHIQPGEIDFCTFPLFALFGPALGMTCIVPEMDASRPASINPHTAIAQMQQFAVTNFFGSPAVLRKLATIADDSKNRLPHLKRVISAGAPATAKVLEQITQLLPDGVEVFTPYGATESLPVANIGSREILNETAAMTNHGHGVCIGKPVTGVRVAVIPIVDAPIPEWNEGAILPAGLIGEFAVSSPIVTKQYFHKPEATRWAKIVEPESGTIWHRMGDVGYFDEHGRMWFCGRKSHRVETEHGTLYTDQVEPIFNTVAGVFRTALVGVKRGERTFPVLCIEPNGSLPEKEIRAELARIGQQYEKTQPIAVFLFHKGFPVDVRHNSKIFREKLAVWADDYLGSKWNGEAQ